ncbi:hypothetical protein KO561_05140 [Radiobacillus kanasensis]|uniref:hypothetical protein n=1 Tax=Radiobacillus kanasensis TaxID=2844358 RepID=UPI001E4732F0|nr:hypothetical protein [Radiobacillus kanasensis]UFU00337.1 hypothetical protein KO561_05140 [Radiobacillus kanasensis]
MDLKKDFLPEDREQAFAEWDCANYCTELATEYMEEKDYKKASMYFENAARSMRVLEDLKQEKQKAPLTFIVSQYQIDQQKLIDLVIARYKR